MPWPEKLHPSFLYSITSPLFFNIFIPVVPAKAKLFWCCLLNLSILWKIFEGDKLVLSKLKALPQIFSKFKKDSDVIFKISTHLSLLWQIKVSVLLFLSDRKILEKHVYKHIEQLFLDFCSILLLYQNCSCLINFWYICHTYV